MNYTVTATYFIDTDLFNGIRAPLMTPIFEPCPLAGKVWKSMEKGKVIIRSPWTVYLFAAMNGLLHASLFDFDFDNIFGVHRSMYNFKNY